MRFLNSCFFSSNYSSWSYYRCPRAIIIFSEFSRSYVHFKKTPWCPRHLELQQK